MEEMDVENPSEDGDVKNSEENRMGMDTEQDSEQGSDLETEQMLEHEKEIMKRERVAGSTLSSDSDSDDSDDASEAADEAEIKILESILSENPYDYPSHVALISKLQRMGELIRLRQARENMRSKYPLSPELWLSWIRDEMKLATTQEQRNEVVKLCEQAIDDYLSVDVWLEYLQYSIGNMGSEKDAPRNVRQLFERALTDVGLHVIKGAIIWEAFREFELVLFTLVDPENIAERKEQLDRIGGLFRRQLACPLLDMEKTCEEYEVWRKGDGAEATIDDKIVQGGYERAFTKLNLRLPFEEKLVSTQGEQESLDAYKAYLLYEKQNGDPGRTIVLYERALTELSLEMSLWLDYLDYLESNIKIETVLERAYRRASRNVPWCVSVWQKWIRAYERWEKPAIEVQSLLESALSTEFSTGEEYRNLWMTYLEYLRRRIDRLTSEEEKCLEVIRGTFNRACEHLAKYFGLEGDRNCVILQFWARTEAIHASNMEKARALWADILSQGHSGTASYWLEYISLERCYGDTKHLRKLYQKALSSVKDWPESIANSWIDFERDEGTLEQMEFCETKTKEKLEKVVEERQRQAQQSSAHHDTASVPTASHSKKPGKRKSEDTGKWKNLLTSPQKSKKLELQRIDKQNAHNNESGKTIAFDINSIEKDERNSEKAEEKIDDRLTVFVSNLDYTATEEEVRHALAPAGTVTLFRMVKDYKGRSKGFCYVQFDSKANVEKALKLDRTSIRGRPMFVSRCASDKAARDSGFKYSSILEKNKLFVKGLPVTMTKEELEKMFEKYGGLKEVRLVTYRNGHSKGLAYVDFEDEASAAKALLSTDGIELEGKTISVAISQPPERKKARPEDSATRVRSLGGSTVSRTSFGLPKTLLSMVPRNVRSSVANGTPDKSAGNGVTPAMSNQEFRNVFLNKK